VFCWEPIKWERPKRKPGRPVGTHAPPVYTARLEIRLTPEEKDLLRRMADWRDMTVSEYVRALVEMDAGL